MNIVKIVSLLALIVPLPASSGQCGARAADEPLITWVTGTVRDENGKPIAGATVDAIAAYNGAMRAAASHAKAVTDETGRYEVKGEGGQSYYEMTATAHKPGMVPECVPLPVQFPAGHDFILSSRGGALDVTILQDAKPAAGVHVTLFKDGINFNEHWILRAGISELKEILYPHQITGADGIAHFENLPPGRFQIIASTQQTGALRVRQSFLTGSSGFLAVADGVAVRVGEVSTQRMSIYAQPNKAEVRAIRHDGKPVTGDAGFEFRYLDRRRSGSARYNADGVTTQTLNQPGLWNISVKYKDEPIKSIPIHEPYYGASGMLAISPRLAPKEPARLTAMRFDLGSMDVDLRDAAGKPAQGSIEILALGVSNPSPLTGRTDEGGHVHFPSLAWGKYTVKGRIDGEVEPDGNAMLHRDDRSAGERRVFWETATISNSSQVHVILQPRPAAYLRVQLRNKDARTLDHYLELTMADQGRSAGFVTGPSDNVFITGPFRPGKTHVRVMPYTTLDPAAGIVRDVTLEPGRVTDLEINVADASARRPASRPMTLDSESQAVPDFGFWRQTVDNPSGISGSVYLADGKTPAFGAMLYYFMAGDVQSHYGAVADVTGVLHGGMLSYSLLYHGTGPATLGPPVAAVLLPGTCGAVILNAKQLEQPLAITLPKSITVRGMLTLAGVNLTGQTGRFRVLAGYQGRPDLAGVLDVWATPQDDGSFALAGLTPGVYQIQASLDGIWLSQSTTLRITDTPPAAPITLNIPTPGGPAIVQCVDAGGKPLIGARVIVDRPAGPLATLYWPAEFTTDGAGEAHIPALEAGKHTARLQETAAGQDFVIPPLPVEQAVVVKLRAGTGK